MPKIGADLASGVVFLGIALCFAIPATGYGLGSSLRLGAGAWPLLLSAMLGLVGLVLILRGALAGAAAGDLVKPVDLRPVVFIILALGFGALTIRSVGVLVAIPGAIMIASLASRRFTLKPALISSLCLTAFTWLVFVKALQVRLPLLAGVL